MSWCLAAPGRDIETTDTFGGRIEVDGTSFAAPHVSGAAAVLIQMFPTLTPDEVVSLILTTARDLGDPGVDAIYGHGLLDLDAATQPVGVMSAATGANVNDTRIAVEGSRVQLGAAFGDAMVTGLSGLQLTVFDAYDRGYSIDMAEFAAAADTALDTDALLRRFANETKNRIALPGGGALSLTLSQADTRDVARRRNDQDHEGRTVGSFSFTQTLVNGAALSFSKGDEPHLALGLHGEERIAPEETVLGRAFASPYLSFVADGWNAVTETPVGGGLRLRVGSFFGSRDDENGDADGWASVGELGSALGGDGWIGLQAGAVFEQDRFLGSHTSGAFAVGEGTPTYFAGVTAEIGLGTLGGGAWRLRAGAWHGISRPEVAADSLIAEVGAVGSGSYALGVTGGDLWRAKDRLSFSVSQPLRVASGEAGLDLATGQDLDGTVRKIRETVSLTPSGRELDFELGYGLPVWNGGNLSVGALGRFQPGHDADAPPEGLFLMRWNQEF